MQSPANQPSSNIGTSPSSLVRHMVDSIELSHNVNTSSNVTNSVNSIALTTIQFNHNYVNESNSIKLNSSSSSTSTDTDDAKMILRSNSSVTPPITNSLADASSRLPSTYSTYKTSASDPNSVGHTTHNNSSNWLSATTYTNSNTTLGTTKSVLMNGSGDALATLVKQYGVSYLMY